jgi:purine nucleosidase
MTADAPRRLVVDTDTASDDAVALLLALRSERTTVEAVTVVAGNVPFDRQVENAKYTLSLVGATDVPVHEGARAPLVKDFEHATDVHGEDGLGDVDVPEVDVPSAERHAVDAIVDAARDAPGEVTLLCIGPLTNLALAVAREPDLPDLLDEVWVMGGSLEYRGNVTPAAEFNFWVDPDAARRVLREFDVHLVDWGVTVRDSTLDGDALDELTALDTRLADFFDGLTSHVRAYTHEEQGFDGVTQPDSLAAACLVAPEVRDVVRERYVEVDEREGLTRGYSLVDPEGSLDEEPRTRVVESVDREAFRDMVEALLAGDAPERAL